MKTFLALLLAMAVAVSAPAAPFHRKAVPKPAPAPALAPPPAETVMPLALPVAEPTAPAAPDPIASISKEDILKTLDHAHQLHIDEVKAQLNAANAVIVNGLKVNLQQAATDLTGAAKEVRRIQGIMDEQARKIAAQAKTIADQQKEIARYHRDKSIVCALLATLAALYLFEMLKPTGLLGGLALTWPWARIAGPVLLWGIVFGICWKAF